MTFSTNITRQIDTYGEFTTVWPNILEGFEVQVSKDGANMIDFTVDELFRSALNVVTTPKTGAVLMLQSRSGKFLGYIILVDTTVLNRPKALSVYIFYSNGKCPTAYRELAEAARRWARENGFRKIRGTLHRMSGSGMRVYTTLFGMRKVSINYEGNL